ncbi:MAG: amidase [Ilumatobacteraceae bacterium]
MAQDALAGDATSQAQALRSGSVSARELVDAAIAAIERVNPALNALIHRRFDAARAEARAHEAGRAGAPFAGVPMVVKDLECAMAGEPHHMGSVFLKHVGHRATEDSYLARRLRDAGFVVLGRTNTPEFGGTITTEPVAYGPTRNPWHLDHSTGGSSGGSAALVAARAVAVAHANDGGGSIRIPASECGLVGLKPSRGRVSKGPDVGESWMGSTIDGVVSRTVRDTAAVLDLAAGYEAGDPYAAPPFARPLAQEVRHAPHELRIGLLARPLLPGGLDDPESRASVEETGRLLEGLGHVVEVAHPPAIGEQRFADLFTTIVAVCTAADLLALERLVGRAMRPDEVEPQTAFMRDVGRATTSTDYLHAVAELHRWSRRVVEWWQPRDGSRGFDLLCTPTIAGPPPRLGVLSGPDAMTHLLAILQYTAQFNVTGQPAISLPLHESRGGLPMGVQLVAAPWREDLLVRIAAQLEQARPWIDRVPGVRA